MALHEIVQRKLNDRDLVLTVDQALEVLTECVKLGEQAAQVAQGGLAVAVIGNTGAGKSTFVNYCEGWVLSSPPWKPLFLPLNVASNRSVQVRNRKRAQEGSPRIYGKGHEQGASHPS